MKELPRLWSDQELDDITNTISQLRRIRTASTIGLEKESNKISSFLNRIYRPVEVPSPEERQLRLQDSEQLGIAAADFFVARVAQTSNGMHEREKWKDTLSDVTSTYKQYPATTYARTATTAVAVSTLQHLRYLSIDPSYLVNWDLFQLNNVGSRNTNELFSGKVGIISPLSGDYLMACTYRSYFDKTKGKIIQLKPAAGSLHLQEIVLPMNPDESNAFENLPEIAIYLDVFKTGNTGRALLNSLHEAYPHHLIHEPDFDSASSLQFDDSKKMNKLLGR